MVGAVVKGGGSPPERQGRSRHRHHTPRRGRGGRSHTPPGHRRSHSRKRQADSHGAREPEGVYKAGGSEQRHSPFERRTVEMGKDRSKDAYIDKDGRHMFVCHVCEGQGKEKCWFTRQTTLTRHMATHQPEGLGYRCPRTPCQHKVRDDRIADLRIHLATKHGEEDYARTWTPGAAIMLQFDTEAAGPSQKKDEPQPPPPDTPYSTAASIVGVNVPGDIDRG